MQSLSTSIVSLHTHIDFHENEKKTKKGSTTKPSIIYFLVLFYSFLSMGFGTGLIGPTLLKFSEQLKTPLDQTVYILFARSFGFLGGTLIGGYLIDRFSMLGRTFVAIVLLIMSITTIVIPMINTFIPMVIIHLIWSLAAGTVDNLAQILTLRHYKQLNVNPYLQALHSAFGIGAFLSPLIIAPFLRKTSAMNEWHYAYWLIGLCHLPNVIWILFYAIRDELCAKKMKEMDLENKEFVTDNEQIEAIIPTDTKTNASENSSSRDNILLLLITIFLLIYVGTESAFGSYLHTYASVHLNFEKDTAAYLNSLFWISFTSGRLCGIPLSLKFSPLQMIFSDLIGCVGSLTLIFVFNKSSLILWIGSVLFGLSVGSIYPSAIAYTETHMAVTGKRMSVLAVGGSTGDAIIPLLIGYSINPKILGPIGFIGITLPVIILASLLFVFIVFCVKYCFRKDQYSDKKDIEEVK